MGIETDLSEIQLPGSVPVMVLGGATLFPKTLLPLFIFEQRYRTMLETALLSDRLLVIAQPEASDGEKLCAVAGIGLIRACVKKEDGTSQLVLQGVGRVSLLDFPQMTPYRIASVKPFGEVHAETPEQKHERLVYLRVVLERGGLPLSKEISEQLARIEEPDILVDIAASAFLKDPRQRQAILGESSNLRRQELLLGFLRENLS